jgi:hypothetical protein
MADEFLVAPGAAFVGNKKIYKAGDSIDGAAGVLNVKICPGGPLN